MNDQQRNHADVSLTVRRTAVLVAVDGEAVGVVAVADAIKDDSKDAIAAMHKLGPEVRPAAPAAPPKCPCDYCLPRRTPRL